MSYRAVCAWCGKAGETESLNFVGKDFCSSDCKINYDLAHNKAQKGSKQTSSKGSKNVTQKPKKAVDEIFYAYEKENKRTNQSTGIIWISIVTVIILAAVAASLR